MRSRSRRFWRTLVALVFAGALVACAGSNADDLAVEDGTTSSPAAPSPIADDSEPAATPPSTPVTTTLATESSSTISPATPTTEPLQCVEQLSVRERAALVVWPAVYAEDWTGAIDTVRDHDVGGVLLMSQRGLGAAEVETRLAELEAASRHGLIVAAEEEGGDVQGLAGIGVLGSQRDVSRTFRADAAEDLIAAHGATIRAVGVDMVFGPVVDVEPTVGEVPLQASRLFDGGPERVAEYGAAYLAGWARAGLFATIKHYPGHGAASGDMHVADGVTPSLDELRDVDLVPYRALVDDVHATDAAVMVGHLTVPGLTDGVPATRSAAAVDHLRDDLGYGDVLLVTDALGMAAVGIAEPEASVLALAAGIDVVHFTMTSQVGAVIEAIEVAVRDGRIDSEHLDAAADKVMTMLGRDGHSCDAASALDGPATTVAPAAPMRCDGTDGTLLTESGRSITLRAAGTDTPTSTLLVIHGFTGTPDGIERVADLTATANAAGIAVAYPQGTPVSPGGFGWNTGAAVFATSSVDDVGALAEMIDAIVATGCVDRDRITITGESNGGGMTLAALCAPRLAGAFRSAVMVVPAVDGGVLDRCAGNGAAQVPLAVAIGAIDTTTPVEGGNGLLPQRQWFDEVAGWRGCTAVEDGATLTPTVELAVGVDCGSCTELFVVADGPHTWPGTRFGNGGSTPGTFDLNRRIIADALAATPGCRHEH